MNYKSFEKENKLYFKYFPFKNKNLKKMIIKNLFQNNPFNV